MSQRTSTYMYSGYVCVSKECQAWFPRQTKTGLCPECVRKAKKESNTKVCRLEECDKVFEGGGNKHYCFKHIDLTPAQKRVENKRLKLKKEREALEMTG